MKVVETEFPFPDKKYKTIYADPPWPEHGAGKVKRGADRHYKLMSVDEIKALPVKSIAEKDCHLYLWVTNNHLKAGLEVMEQWGFRYITTITWAKDKIGLGQYYRGQTEHCLFGVRGKLPYRYNNGRRVQGSTLILAKRKKHSAKPEKVRNMIERVSHPPRIELFSREKREGWDAWGLEVPRSMQAILIEEDEERECDLCDDMQAEYYHEDGRIICTPCAINQGINIEKEGFKCFGKD